MESFRYDTERQLLICLTHGQGVLPSYLTRHLRNEHRGMSLADRQRFIAGTNEDWPLANPESISLPADGSAPIPDLLVYDGFRCSMLNCNNEPEATSLSKKVVHDHICMYVGLMVVVWISNLNVLDLITVADISHLCHYRPSSTTSDISDISLYQQKVELTMATRSLQEPRIDSTGRRKQIKATKGFRRTNLNH